VRKIFTAPLVSVVIPAYNAGDTIKRSIQSALDQTYASREIIIVDDGSTDQTLAVARECGSRIEVLEQPHHGPAVARNAGISRARGELVAFLDSDDYWRPAFLGACVDALGRSSSLVAVSTAGEVIDRNGRHTAFPRTLTTADVETKFYRNGIEAFFDFWSKHDHIRTGNCTIRRSVLLEAGGQNEHLRLGEDLELWALLATYGQWAYIPDQLWVCDSVRATANTGWTKKYAERRRLCPTVQDWQRRVLPRLGEVDGPGFKRVRGRIAAVFAHNHVLGGNSVLARSIVAEYGAEMPTVWSAQLLRMGDRLGGLAWSASCLLIRCREHQKAWALRMRNLRIPG